MNIKQFYIAELKIKKVGHLNNITIPLSKNELKHLIITGRNGNGEVSVLESIIQLFESVTPINDDIWKKFTSVQEQQNVEAEFNVLLKEINIQFIVSTHSPFALNSLENIVIYNLEERILIKDGLVDIHYQGIVEGYFKTSELSDLLR